jgi:hypothetical protein
MNTSMSALNAPTTAKWPDERRAEKARKRSKVVQREVGTAAICEDVVRGDRKVCVSEQLMAKDPDVPDIRSEITGRIAEQMCLEMTRQWPREDARQHAVAGDDSGPEPYGDQMPTGMRQ